MDASVAPGGDVFELADRLGFAGVELSVGRAELRSNDLANVRHRLGDRSLEIHALVLGDHNHGGIADGDPTVAEAAAEDVRLAVDRAVELGADVILVPFFMRGQLVGEDGFDRCAVASRPVPRRSSARGHPLLRGTAAPRARSGTWLSAWARPASAATSISRIRCGGASTARPRSARSVS